MSYIDKNLLADERIVYRTRKHFIIFTIPVILTVLTLILFMQIPPMIDKFLGGTSLQNTRYFIIFAACIGPAVFAAFYWVKEWLNYVTSDFVVTTKRLIMKEGFFVRKATDARLTTISHVTVDQTLLGQIMDYGTVVVNNFGGSRDVFLLISRPIKFQQQVNMQLDKVSK